MTAVGTARPIAQGQAMISTVTAATMPWSQRGLGTEKEPDHEGERGEDHDHRHEHPGDAVGQALDRRLGALGLLAPCG